jgi:hypothetical protein
MAREKGGCLLHPLQNHGIDLRDVSFYGKDFCHGHFCPGYHYISREEKQSLIAIIDDWYLYGLCVTDVDLIREYFCVIANRIAETPAPEKFKNGVLKEIALYRSHSKGRFNGRGFLKGDMRWNMKKRKSSLRGR